MDNWNFTGRPDIPAWPQDEQGQKEKAVLLMQTFDSPADTDMVISLLAAYGIPCFKYYDLDGGAGKVINGFSGYGASLYVPLLTAGGGKGAAGVRAGGGRGNGTTRLKGVYYYAGLQEGIRALAGQRRPERRRESGAEVHRRG